MVFKLGHPVTVSFYMYTFIVFNHCIVFNYCCHTLMEYKLLEGRELVKIVPDRMNECILSEQKRNLLQCISS